MPFPAPISIFRFGQYQVDLSNGDLLKDGRRIRLQQKPLQVLAVLAANAGRVVSRAELHQQLWPEGTMVDLEDGLNTAVRKLREALSDNADQPQYIETVPRRGYRFLASVEWVERSTPEGQSVLPKHQAASPSASSALFAGAGEAQSSDPQQFQPRDSIPQQPPFLNGSPDSGSAVPAPARSFLTAHPGRLIIVLLLLLLLCGGIYRVVAHGRARAASGEPLPSVVVLPFKNLTGDPARSYLSDGITEELITRLASANGSNLRVIARTSSMSFRDTTETVLQIGTDLKVGYVLEGSLQGEGSHIRVIAQLIRTGDQSHLWAKSYDGELAELPSFERNIAEASAQSILPGSRAAPSREEAPSSAEAHDQYLQGLSFLARRSQPGFQNALLCFGRAVQLDPNYARAYAGLAVTYNLMGQYHWMRQAEASSQGRAAALQALALDPDLAEAKAALGFADWFYEWNPVQAQKELSGALLAEPNNVDAHHWLSQLLMTSGHLEEAEQQMHLAMALDPKALILRTNLGWIHYTARKYPLALQEMQDVLADNPEFLSAHVKLWYVYTTMKDETKAWAQIESIISVIYDESSQRQIKDAYSKGGYTSGLRALAAVDDGNSYGNAMDRARALTFADDKAGAIRELHAGVERRDGWMIFVPSDPAFDSLRSDPAYQRIIQQISGSKL